MRVLILHNRYRHEGGEERAVVELAALLRRRGHGLEVMERSSSAVNSGRAARGLILGGVDPGAVFEAVRRSRADVVHAHNVHPLFGWRALAAAKQAGARTVVHLHNFRLFCAIGVASRDGGPCFRCRGRDTRPGVRLRCRGSLGEAAVYAAGLALQQPRLIELTDAFISVSAAHAQRLFALGLPRANVHVLSNFVAEDRLASESRAGAGRYALASGRLVQEKGFDTAIAASRVAGVPLIIAGDGPDRPRLEQLGDRSAVRFVGRVPPPVLARLRSDAAVVLVPSRSHDAFPYAALDALADGIPVLASDYGGLPELVGHESVVPRGDVGSWSRALTELWRAPECRQERGTRALERVRAKFLDERHYENLMRIYRGLR